MTEHFIYIYLDPRKKGNYEFGKYKFEYEPFYIGYGKNKRHLSHINPKKWRRDKNKHKVNKIKKIINTCSEPIIIKLYENLKPKEAKKIEIELINLIGRYDKQLGPLVNMTSGGDGIVDNVITEETREKLSKVWKGRKRKPFTEEHKKNISKATSGKNNANWKHGRTNKKTNCEKCNKSISKYNKKGAVRSLCKSCDINPFYGKSHTDETKQKISLKCKGNIPPNAKKIVMLDINGNIIKIFKSLAEAVRETKYNSLGITQCCKGERETYKDYKWEYGN